MKIKYYVTPKLYYEMRKNYELVDPSICDKYYKKFRDGDMCNRYYGLHNEKEEDCNVFCDIAEYDDLTNSFLVLMPSEFPYVRDVVERKEREEARIVVASNKDTPEEILSELADDDNKNVRLAVAKNDNTSKEILMKLGFKKNSDIEIIKAVTKNKNTDIEIIDALNARIKDYEQINKDEEKLTLTDFLNYFNFDYVLYDNNLIGLIDEQGANLGNIEDERFTNDTNGVLNIVDRLDAYYQDYIFDSLEQVLRDKHNFDTDKMNWKDLYIIVKVLKLDYDMDILPYIFSEKEIILDSDTKEIKEEYIDAEQQL